MKNLKITLVVNLFMLFILMMQGCSFSTANMSSLETSKDKEGKQKSSTFKSGDTLYAKANIANNPGKVKVKYYLVADDVKGVNKGETLKGSDVSVDLDGDGVASYNVPVAPGFPGGTYTLNADMINENGEKKDSKTAKVTVEAAAAPPAVAPDADSDNETKTDSDSDK
jgi:hypothetical protein